MDNTLRRRILVMRGLMQRLDCTDLGLKQRTGGRIDLKTSFDCDILNFLMFIMDSDGRIDDAEAETVNFYLGYHVTAQRITEYIEAHNLTTEDYTAEIPLTLQALTDADTVIIGRRAEAERTRSRKDALEDDFYLDSDDTYVPTSLLLLEIYQDLGQAEIYSNENVDETENENYTAFISALRKYVTEKLSLTEEELSEKETLLKEDHTR
jgi:hypothetical protein